MLVTLSSNTLTIVSRGVDGTSASSHASGATIYPVFTATDADEANELTAKYANRGSIVYQGASTFEELPKGTQGHALVIGANDPAWGQVDTVGIADDAITSAKILANAVGSSEIATGAVGVDELATAVINRLVPVGTIAMYAGATAPTGWLLCDGTTSTSGYTALAAIVGGTTPDLKGRVPVGAGTGTGLTARTLGATGGAETHVLTTSEMPSHRHGGAVGSNGTHAHFYNQTTVTQRKVFNNDLDEIDDVVNAFGTATTATDGAHIHSIEFEGGGAGHNNMQPFRVVNYIIKHD